MKREISRDEEPRELARVSEDSRDGAGLLGGKADRDAGWLEAGAEDPAFFIKPSDEDRPSRPRR